MPRKGEGRISQRVHFLRLEVAQRVVEAFSRSLAAATTLPTHRWQFAWRRLVRGVLAVQHRARRVVLRHGGAVLGEACIAALLSLALNLSCLDSILIREAGAGGAGAHLELRSRREREGEGGPEMLRGASRLDGA